jgi:hypothetical protein
MNRESMVQIDILQEVPMEWKMVRHYWQRMPTAGDPASMLSTN